MKLTDEVDDNGSEMFAMQHMVDIVIPVYRGVDSTRRCIESVINHHQITPVDLIVIDDGSPEPDLTALLNEFSSCGKITLIRNPVNRGFTAAANQGLALHPERDLILLNSDTEVCGEWVDRLKRCIYADDTIGTVTPFSNNGTLCSYPDFCEENDLPRGLSLIELDNLFKLVNAGKWIEIPTSVGFCMYFRRKCLKEVGVLDEKSFPFGYGEENDFCMRAARRGWRHALSADTFVYHLGGVSFGERRTALQEQGRKQLALLHPDYQKKVHDFIRLDPVKPLRYAVDLARSRLNTDQAREVLLEWSRRVARLQTANHELEDALKYAQDLVQQIEAQLGTYVTALGQAEVYVREREADVANLKQEIKMMHATNSDLRRMTPLGLIRWFMESTKALLRK